MSLNLLIRIHNVYDCLFSLGCWTNTYFILGGVTL